MRIFALLNFAVISLLAFAACRPATNEEATGNSLNGSAESLPLGCELKDGFPVFDSSEKAKANKPTSFTKSGDKISDLRRAGGRLISAIYENQNNRKFLSREACKCADNRPAKCGSGGCTNSCGERIETYQPDPGDCSRGCVNGRNDRDRSY